MRTGVIVAALACLALAGCRRGSKSAGTGTGAGAGKQERDPTAALRLVPRDALFVVAADLARIRTAPITAKLGALRVVFGPVVSQVEAFTAGSGFDPWTQIDSVTMAGVSLKGETAIVLRGRGLDEARLTAHARARLADAGDELVARKLAKWTLWSARSQPESVAVFLDAGTLVLGSSAWIERIVEIADGADGATSAASNPTLVAACAQVSTNPLWAAGVLPDEARKILEGDLELRSIGSMQRVTLGVELAEQLDAKLAVDFGDATQADALAEDVAKLLHRERREKREIPAYQALFKGLTEYADGPTFRAELRLANDFVVQLAENSARLVNWGKPSSELPAPTAHALTLKPDWLAPPPANVTMSDVRSYDAWDRRTHALFEVANRGDKPALPEIVIRYRDGDDKKLDERRCIVPMLVLLPHESAGCDPGVPATAVSGIYTIRTAPDERAAALARKSRRTLKVVGARLEPAGGAVQWLSGEVKNTTGEIVRDARVHATFHDAGHKIVGTGDVIAAPNLAPGASATFRLASGPLFAPAKSFAAIGYSLVGPR